jgi:hypothetical protein
LDCPKEVQSSSKHGTKKSSSKQEEVKVSAKKEKTSRHENSYFAALTLGNMMILVGMLTWGLLLI